MPRLTLPIDLGYKFPIRKTETAPPGEECNKTAASIPTSALEGMDPFRNVSVRIVVYALKGL